MSLFALPFKYVRSSNLASLLAPLIQINPQKNKCKNKTIN